MRMQRTKKTTAIVLVLTLAMGLLGVLPLTVSARTINLTDTNSICTDDGCTHCAIVIDLSVSPNPPSGAGWTYANTIFTIQDGANVTVMGRSDIRMRRIVVAAGAKATITLDGASIFFPLGVFVPPMLINPGANLTLNLVENTINTMSSWGGAGIQTTDATLNITSTITSAGATGGTLNAMGGGNAAAIGGSDNNAGGTVNISGDAIVNASIREDAMVHYFSNITGRGAGIGGGQNGAGGTVTISGNAIVNAAGGNNGAGIGGGLGGNGGTVTISDNATVTATGGRGLVTGGLSGAVNYSGGGAGIGGGGQYGATSAGAGGTITISNTANVTATGGSGSSRAQGGAGIGGGGAGAFVPSGGDAVAVGTRGRGAVFNDTAHTVPPGVLNVTGGNNGANAGGGQAFSLHRARGSTSNGFSPSPAVRPALPPLCMIEK